MVVLGKTGLISIGNGAEIQPLEKGRKSPGWDQHISFLKLPRSQDKPFKTSDNSIMIQAKTLWIFDLSECNRFNIVIQECTCLKVNSGKVY